MEIAISILHETPYFEILLWIMRRRRFPSGLWFQIPALSSAHGSISGGLQHEGHSTFDLSMLMSFDTSGEPGYAVSIVQSNFATLGKFFHESYYIFG